MKRRTALVAAIALLSAVGGANPGGTRAPETERSAGREPQAEAGPPEGREGWRARLLGANRELASARKRRAAAESAYQSMRHRRRPRGEGKQAIMDELEASREDLARAKRELEDLEKAARRAGAPPSWLEFDPADIEAATQTPASQQP